MFEFLFGTGIQLLEKTKFDKVSFKLFISALKKKINKE